jgi:hypothetical protein
LRDVRQTDAVRIYLGLQAGELKRHAIECREHPDQDAREPRELAINLEVDSKDFERSS